MCLTDYPEAWRDNCIGADCHPSAHVSIPRPKPDGVTHTSIQVTSSLKANSWVEQNKQDEPPHHWGDLAQCFRHFKHTYPYCVHFSGSVCTEVWYRTLLLTMSDTGMSQNDPEPRVRL